MARYNAGTRPTPIQRRTGAKVVNRAGGEAFAESPEVALASLLLTSFVRGQFYRSANEQLSDMHDLLSQNDPLFAAKAAVFARREFGMRSISHAVAAEIAHYTDKPWAEEVKGSAWVRPFFSAIVDRPDDMTEILAYYLSKWGKPIPRAVKYGFARAFKRIDSYGLAKYRAEQRGVKMVDVVNLFHPAPSARNAEALTQLVKGTLRSEGTWESRLTEAGKQAEGKEDKAERKAQAWGDLLRENKLGYLALVRNLRNILQDAPDALPLALSQVVDPNRVHKGRMFPFQYLVAAQAFKTERGEGKSQVLKALDEALEISVDNVPALDGRTLIAVDVSGSMGMRANKDGVFPSEMAGIFAAALYKRAEAADLMAFEGDARYVTNVQKSMSIRQIATKFKPGGSTNFHSIFVQARGAYDRIIILSDEQGWVNYKAPTSSFSMYRQRFEGVNPRIFTFDLMGYGDLQFPETNVYALAGLSEKVFDIMKMLDEDRNALVNRIKAVQFE